MFAIDFSVKRIGETCSVDEICAASGSYCSLGECICPGHTVPRFDNNSCVDEKDTWPSETCTASAGSRCLDSSGCDRNPYAFAEGAPPACSCPHGYKTRIMRDTFTTDLLPGIRVTCDRGQYSQIDSTHQCGKIYVYIVATGWFTVAVVVGDACTSDSDCWNIVTRETNVTTSIATGVCLNHRCACPKQSQTPDISGLICGIRELLMLVLVSQTQSSLSSISYCRVPGILSSPKSIISRLCSISILYYSLNRH